MPAPANQIVVARAELSLSEAQEIEFICDQYRDASSDPSAFIRQTAFSKLGDSIRRAIDSSRGASPQITGGTRHQMIA